jgi:hypothetical protein
LPGGRDEIAGTREPSTLLLSQAVGYQPSAEHSPLDRGSPRRIHVMRYPIREYQNDSPSALSSLVFLAFKQSNTSFKNLLDWSNHITMRGMGRACVIALLPLLLACARADEKPDLQTIIDAWKAREQKVESFDFRWWSKRHESRDANLPGANPIGTLKDKFVPGNPIAKPENDSIWRYRFVVDAGSRYLYEEFGHDWIPEKGEFVPSHSVELFDGKLLKYFYGKGRFDHPHVTIEENPKGPLVGRSTWADPIKMVFRPFSLASRTFDPKNLVLTNETEMIDNNRVLVLGDENRTVWVDPAKDYLPVRWASTAGDYRAEVTYQRDEVVGWVPHSWTIKRLRDSETATVTQFAINKPIADSTFALDLRDGALLQNNSERPITLSIIYPDGKQRLLKREEHSKSFEELLKTEPDD